MTTRDENRMFDVRTLERNLRKGLITHKDYEKYLAKLPDAADRSVVSKPDESRDDRDDARYLPQPTAMADADTDDEGDDLDMPGYGAEDDDEDDDEDEDEVEDEE